MEECGLMFVRFCWIVALYELNHLKRGCFWTLNRGKVTRTFAAWGIPLISFSGEISESGGSFKLRQLLSEIVLSEIWFDCIIQWFPPPPLAALFLSSEPWLWQEFSPISRFCAAIEYYFDLCTTNQWVFCQFCDVAKVVMTHRKL